MPLALESAWAVAGGLIPIVGALGIFFIIFLAVRDSPDEGEGGDRRDGEE
ncbi:MAG TPA: hypothetical protein VLL27_09085 [Solirubrobacterales bacterium]|nr:hypothetical protein [Solirubrobacterales bacterium]